LDLVRQQLPDIMRSAARYAPEHVLNNRNAVPAVLVPLPVSDGGLRRFAVAARQLADGPGGIDHVTRVLSSKALSHQRAPVATAGCSRDERTSAATSICVRRG
jgi:hypothetical protein